MIRIEGLNECEGLVKSRAIISMICNDSFIPGITALSKTVRKYSKYPFYVICSKEISNSAMTRISSLCDGVITVDSISNPCVTNDDACWAASEYLKLHIWNLCQFEKIVYLDADTLLIDCIDELFDLDTDFAAAPDIFPPDRFNAGVLVIRPDAQIFKALLGNIRTLQSYDGGDTGYLNAFFPNWFSSSSVNRLPFAYNAQRTMYWFTHEKRPGYWEAIGKIKILHYSSSPKPWEVSGGKALGDLEWIWWQHYMGVIQGAGSNNH